MLRDEVGVVVGEDLREVVGGGGGLGDELREGPFVGGWGVGLVEGGDDEGFEDEEAAEVHTGYKYEWTRSAIRYGSAVTDNGCGYEVIEEERTHPQTRSTPHVHFSLSAGVQLLGFAELLNGFAGSDTPAMHSIH